MLKVCNVDIRHSKKIYKRLKAFIANLKKKFSIEDVYLYGSFATGNIHEGSDIDLLIVGDFKGKIFQRIAGVLGLTNLPIEPLVYTPEEFKKMKKTNPFLKKIILTGKKL